jgi:hypothetical protein
MDQFAFEHGQFSSGISYRIGGLRAAQPGNHRERGGDDGTAAADNEFAAAEPAVTGDGGTGYTSVCSHVTYPYLFFSPFGRRREKSNPDHVASMAQIL